MNALERSVEIAFMVFDGVLAGQAEISLDDDDIRLISKTTASRLNAVTAVDPFFGSHEVFSRDEETGAVYYSILLDNTCIRLASDALTSLWRKSGKPRNPTKLFQTVQEIHSAFKNRTIAKARGDLNAMAARWRKKLRPDVDAAKGSDVPSYGLVYHRGTDAIMVAWPNNKKRRARALDIKIQSQCFRVFLAMLKAKNIGESVSDIDLASQLFPFGSTVRNPRRSTRVKRRTEANLKEDERSVQGGYDLGDPKVNGKIRRWVCEFNRICSITTGEKARPLVRRKGKYELTVDIAETS